MHSQRLSQTKKGVRVIVKSVSANDKKLADKLMSMGIVEGTVIEVMQAAPLGDPIRIKLMGYQLSLRLSEADSIEILSE